MRTSALRTLCFSLVLAAVIGPIPSIRAASLQVAPTSVTLKPTENAAALWLSNADEQEPLRAQARLFRWVQENGEERLEATPDLSVSPPMIELPAGERQLIRVIRTSSPPSGAETAYRVLVDELPPAQQSEEGGLRFAMRYSVPVFILPAGDAPIRYQLQSRLEPGTPPALAISNSGNQHAQIADLAWIGADGARKPLIAGLVGYVLPGQTMRWTLPSDTPATPGGHFAARINGEQEEQTLALAPAGR